MTVDDHELLEDAKRMEKELWVNGDPFDGDDWSLLHIIRGFIRRVEAERAAAAKPDAVVDIESLLSPDTGENGGA